MQTEPVQLTFQVPAPSGQRAPVLRLLTALEGALEGARLAWRTEVNRPAGTPPGAGRLRLVELPDRDAWVAERLSRVEPVLLFGGPLRPGLSVSVQPATDVRVAGGGGVGTVVVHLAPGTAPAQLLPDVLVSGGDALGAYCCQVTPGAAAGLLLQVQLAPPGPVRPGVQALLARLPALAGLPRLRGALGSLPVAEAPLSLGWLNYWSEATARWLGFPEPARDAEWLARATRTPAGAWVLRLTDEPLDVERPEHLDALVRAYRRFDRLGA